MYKLTFLIFLLTLFVNNAKADVSSTFDTGDDGWRIVSFNNLTSGDYAIAGTYNATFNASGGSPGGYISATDPDGGDFTFSAPSRFLGNQAAATRLSYDLSHPQGTPDYQTSDVILLGNGTKLLWQSNPSLLPGVNKITVTVDLSPSANWTVNTTNGPKATTDDFKNVLGNLSGFYIRGEYTNGADLSSLDNVNLIISGSPPVGTVCPSDTFNNGKLTINSVEVPNGFGGITKYKATLNLQPFSNPLGFTLESAVPLQ